MSKDEPSDYVEKIERHTFADGLLKLDIYDGEFIHVTLNNEDISISNDRESAQEAVGEVLEACKRALVILSGNKQ